MWVEYLVTSVLSGFWLLGVIFLFAKARQLRRTLQEQEALLQRSYQKAPEEAYLEPLAYLQARGWKAADSLSRHDMISRWRASAQTLRHRVSAYIEMMPQLGLLGTVVSLVLAATFFDFDTRTLGLALNTTIMGLVGALFARWVIENPAEESFFNILEMLQNQEVVGRLVQVVRRSTTSGQHTEARDEDIFPPDAPSSSLSSLELQRAEQDAVLTNEIIQDVTTRDLSPPPPGEMRQAAEEMGRQRHMHALEEAASEASTALADSAERSTLLSRQESDEAVARLFTPADGQMALHTVVVDSSDELLGAAEDDASPQPVTSPSVELHVNKVFDETSVSGSAASGIYNALPEDEVPAKDASDDAAVEEFDRLVEAADASHLALRETTESGGHALVSAQEVLQQASRTADLGSPSKSSPVAPEEETLEDAAPSLKAPVSRARIGLPAPFAINVARTPLPQSSGGAALEDHDEATVSALEQRSSETQRPDESVTEGPEGEDVTSAAPSPQEGPLEEEETSAQEQDATSSPKAHPSSTLEISATSRATHIDEDTPVEDEPSTPQSLDVEGDEDSSPHTLDLSTTLGDAQDEDDTQSGSHGDVQVSWEQEPAPASTKGSGELEHTGSSHATQAFDREALLGLSPPPSQEPSVQAEESSQGDADAGGAQDPGQTVAFHQESAHESGPGATDTAAEGAPSSQVDERGTQAYPMDANAAQFLFGDIEQDQTADDGAASSKPLTMESDSPATSSPSSGSLPEKKSTSFTERLAALRRARGESSASQAESPAAEHDEEGKDDV